jgi:threonine dehydrogenase-like Zn-dependent dehydrogenase
MISIEGLRWRETPGYRAQPSIEDDTLSRMIAVHFEKRRASIRKVAKPRRPGGYAVIRLLYGGICNTDIELLRGYYGFAGTPGHEFVGEVLEADDSRLTGRRVVGEINLACRRCDWCKRGLGRHCPTRKVLGIVGHAGAFREFLTLPEVNLHIVPSKIPDEIAVFAEPLAAACEILDQASFPRGSEIAVLGDGKLGLLAAQVLQAAGHRVHQFGRHPGKLRIAAKAGVVTEVARKNLPAAAYDWVVEATGSREGLRQAVHMTRPRGTVFMKSTVHGHVALDTAPVVVNEITLVGSRCGRFEPALKLLQAGKIHVSEMISEEFPLSDARRAFQSAMRPGVMKVMLRG